MRPKGISGHDDKKGFYEPLHKAKSSGAIEAIIRFEDNMIFFFPSLFSPFFFLSGSKSRKKLECLVHSCGVRVWLQALYSVTQRDYNLIASSLGEM